MGPALDRLAFSATLHCLTGCAAGEVTGMAIATALGWSNAGQIGLAVGLAYLFGFGLTALPLVRAGLAAGAIVSTALASDTISITIMEVIDNLFVVLIPGAMDAGVGEALLWASVAGGFVIAFPFAFLANRWLIARGKGCAHAHQPHPWGDVAAQPGRRTWTASSAGLGCSADSAGSAGPRSAARRAAAPTNSRNSGSGRVGRDLNSG